MPPSRAEARSDSVESPEPLWRPSADQVERAAITRFATRAGAPTDYPELLDWSTADLGRFWTEVADQLGVTWRTPPTQALGSTAMPGAEWFPGAELNWAEHVFADRVLDDIALRSVSETRGLDVVEDWTWARLGEETRRIRAGLKELGVGRGDRVAAYLPNIPETVAALLATASLGAIWACAAPEFGADSVVARFGQIEPTVFLSVDGYLFRGKEQSRSESSAAIAETIGARHVELGYLSGTGWPETFGTEPEKELTFEAVPFAHPLWVLFSSGTTGLPKAIMHGHGGVLLEQLKSTVLQLDVRPGDRFFWFTTTGWMMWNFLVGSLLGGATAVLYDAPLTTVGLWDLASRTGITQLGASAGYLDQCRREGVRPTEGRDLSALRAVGSTGSPLAPECYDWVYAELPGDLALFSVSGGTDVVTAFLGATPTFPVYRGELAPAALGVDLQAFDPDGHPVTGQVGELVITQPMPSMPVGFWGDDTGEKYREAYFERFPGIWTHGDWLELTERRTGIITGRSDATINRGGVRMGSAEIYNALLTVPEVADALVVDVARADTQGVIVLFVVTADGAALTDDLRTQIFQAIRTGCSPRHVPDEVRLVSDIPRTSSGKKLEVPIKRILGGADPEKVVSRSSLANPEALEEFVRMRESPS